VLCLAGGGGQQAPILAAHGAVVTVFDNSARQLAKEKMVAEREGYEIALVKGDMTRRLPFGDGEFDLVVHPISNCYVENVYHVWRECHRVLKKGGILLAGMDNGINFLFNDYEALMVENQLPYNPLRDKSLAASADDGVQFSHTLAEQIGGQLRAGFRLTDLMDDYDRPGNGKLGEHTPLYMITRAVKD
jgi:SAM-dependent methyltransferase